MKRGKVDRSRGGKGITWDIWEVAKLVSRFSRIIYAKTPPGHLRHETELVKFVSRETKLHTFERSFGEHDIEVLSEWSWLISVSCVYTKQQMTDDYYQTMRWLAD